ncbi:MAG: ice-binding family protein [Candidatus Delongbacteria bacterium]|jgi:hypothetical protein|nr:ice-binding family protein [Candidatus Delongbacteria bacterium]
MKINKDKTLALKKGWTKILKGISLLIILMIPTAIIAQPIDPVDLGSTAGFVILAGAEISNVPTSAVTGDVGLSPAAGSYITGFGLLEVTGTIYAVDATGPASSVIDATGLTAAKGDLTIAYNDAAERTPVPTGEFLNPGAGNLGGQFLAPGLYKFTGTAEITAGNLTFDAQNDPNAVFIMQVTSELSTASGTQVILINQARAENIFWQVGTSAALGSYSIFKGTIMADQSITMYTGATIDGRLLARIAAVTIDACTVNTPESSGIEYDHGTPNGFELFQNYPNPFNPTTAITFSLKSEGIAELNVYNHTGELVSSLVNGQMDAGHHTVNFDATNLSAGVYYYTLKANNMTMTNKMVLVK